MTDAPVTFEHTFRCRCGVSESWTTERAAQAAAVWHTFTEHPALWQRVVGDRLPQDSKPERYGHRYEPWESQAPILSEGCETV